LPFDIVPSDPTPIYRQIVDQVRRQVAAGRLAAGDELPSVRSLAAEHAINPMTVSKAYGLLETEGLLERRRGQGMFVAAIRASRKPAARLALLEPTLVAAAQQASQLGLRADEALHLFARCLQDQGVGEAASPSDPSAHSIELQGAR
jgi:GntR family transcriptional regulator